MDLRPKTHSESDNEIETDAVRVLSKAIIAVRNLRREMPYPRITIITPTWNTRPEWFVDLALSILGQIFADWQWCIVDDCSSNTDFHPLLAKLQELSNVKVEKLEARHGISGATNRGLQLASGRFVCFVDHDDVLTPDALSECAAFLGKDWDAVYTDSDKIDDNGCHNEPFYKPDWSPEYFRGVMYVGHLLCVDRDLALAAGGFNSDFDGVQDYEFFLRVSELTSRIGHIPKILYHWRAAQGSVAQAPDAKGNLGQLQQRAVQAQLDRLKLSAEAEPGIYSHRVRVVPRARLSFPKVSIIIPTKNHPDILHKCLYSLFSETVYPNFEVFCVDNATTDSRAIKEMRAAPVERLLWPGTFNYSKVNNLAVNHSAGEYLVFMNNDIEILVPQWIEEMLYYAEQQDVGAVGSLLTYPDGSVQHCGVVLGCRGTADHVSRSWAAESDGYAGSLSCAREVSAVTAACLMIRRELYCQVGGFNEHFFTAYQDVDLCLRLRKQNKRIIFTPHARFVHHESLSRGKDYDYIDRTLLLDLWGTTILEGDPYYNPNFNVEACDYSLQ